MDLLGISPLPSPPTPTARKGLWRTAIHQHWVIPKPEKSLSSREQIASLPYLCPRQWMLSSLSFSRSKLSFWPQRSYLCFLESLCADISQNRVQCKGCWWLSSKRSSGFRSLSLKVSWGWGKFHLHCKIAEDSVHHILAPWGGEEPIIPSQQQKFLSILFRALGDGGEFHLHWQIVEASVVLVSVPWRGEDCCGENCRSDCPAHLHCYLMYCWLYERQSFEKRELWLRKCSHQVGQ